MGSTSTWLGLGLGLGSTSNSNPNPNPSQAAFYEPLIASGLGAGFAPGTGYGSDKKESSFAVGLKNVSAEAVAEVEAAIDATLRRLAREGFPRAQVDAVEISPISPLHLPISP